jgi:apolipoprotein D and lipocalin family protein
MLVKKTWGALRALPILILCLSGCASSKNPLPTPDHVDLPKFMGAWFVHGYTPILVDGRAHNAVEHYFLNENGEIETTYQFRDGSSEGELKTYTPKGFPDKNDDSDARWKMQFLWPFRADYVILYVSDDYARTVIAHPSRKYAWIMNRSTTISESHYEAMLEKLEDVGYDLSVIQRLPHDWSKEGKRLKKIEAIGVAGPLAER